MVVDLGKLSGLHNLSGFRGQLILAQPTNPLRKWYLPLVLSLGDGKLENSLSCSPFLSDFGGVKVIF